MNFNNIKNKFKESYGLTFALSAFVIPICYIVIYFLLCNIGYCRDGFFGWFPWQTNAIISGVLIGVVISIISFITSIAEIFRNRKNKLARMGLFISLIIPAFIILAITSLIYN
jgi:hypothetical protein